MSDSLLDLGLIQPLNLINQLPCHFAIKNKDSVYQVGNDKLAKLIGYKDGEALAGITDFDIKCPAAKHAKDFIQHDKLVMQSGQTTKGVMLSTYAAGDIKCLLVTKSPIIDSAGSVQGVACSTLDLEEYPILMRSVRLLAQNKHLSQRLKQENYLYLDSNFPCAKIRLTKRETETLYYLLRGKSATQIGEVLFVSHRTIQTHMENIKLKFDCDSKSQVIEKAIELGYIYHIPESILALK